MGRTFARGNEALLAEKKKKKKNKKKELEQRDIEVRDFIAFGESNE